MKQICAWCGKVIKEGQGKASHGICPECIEILEETWLNT